MSTNTTSIGGGKKSDRRESLVGFSGGDIALLGGRLPRFFHESKEVFPLL